MSDSCGQAIIWTNANIVNSNIRNKFSEIASEIHTILIQENLFQNIVYEIAAILSRP